MDIDIKAIIRIFTDSIIFDWGKPFNNTNNSQSIGTGFFIDSQYILTCYHVIENATKRTVVVITDINVSTVITQLHI